MRAGAWLRLCAGAHAAASCTVDGSGNSRQRQQQQRSGFLFLYPRHGALAPATLDGDRAARRGWMRRKGGVAPPAGVLVLGALVLVQALAPALAHTSAC